MFCFRDKMAAAPSAELQEFARKEEEFANLLNLSIMASVNSAFGSPSPRMHLTVPNITPEPHKTVDSYLTEILSAVTGDDSPLCSSCEEGISASSRCRDCSEMLCDPCVRAHKRVRLTRDHRIVRFPAGSGKGSMDSLGSYSSTGSTACTISPEPASVAVAPPGLPQEPSLGVKDNLGVSTNLEISTSTATLALSSNHFCELHGEPNRLFCETCSNAACSECVLMLHRGHNLIYIHDAEESARNASLRLSMETRCAISELHGAIDDVRVVRENVEIQALRCTTEIRNLIKKYVNTVEGRERDLLKRIDTHLKATTQPMIDHIELLRHTIAKLQRSSFHLDESYEHGTGLDILRANERASEALKQLPCLCPDFAPTGDNMVFIPPDNALIKAIYAIGTMCTENFARILAEERRLLEKLECEVRRGSIRGRSIHNSYQPVVARDFGGGAVAIFGGEGEMDGQLCRPWGVCCDRLGQIIVADRSNNRVQIYSPNGRFLKNFGVQGTGPGQFDRPAGVAVDPLNRIVVADKDNHRIQIFTSDGTYLAKFGEKGCRNGQFNYPWDVAVNSHGQIVVSDTRNHRIQLFTSEGAFINKYGFEGSSSMWKHFDSPRGVCFNSAGSVIVTDFNNHRLVIIDPNFVNAQCLGQEGSGCKQFMRPQGICCDDEGRIVVADSRNNRIQVFEANGTFLWSMGKAGTNLGELDRPSGVCITPEGRIVVVDFGNNRVQIF